MGVILGTTRLGMATGLRGDLGVKPLSGHCSWPGQFA